MAFKVPASKASKGQDQFEFEIDGKTYAVRKAKFISVGTAEALESPESSTVVLDFFGKAGTKQGDAVRSLDEDQFTALIEAWRADSEVGLGESEASSS